MSPSSLPTLQTSQEFDQGHKAEQDGSPLFNEETYEVQLEPEDDPHQLSLFRRWLAVLVISGTALCVACGGPFVSILLSVLLVA
jgi:hypothetical protein